MGPLYKGHFGTLILVLITEVSSIQRSYYSTTLGHRIVSLLQRFPQFRGHTTVLHWDTELCPYYRGFLNSEVILQYYTGTQNCVLITEVSSIQRSYCSTTLGHRIVSLLQRFPQFRGHTAVLDLDTEWCPYYRGFHISEVFNGKVPVQYILNHVHTYVQQICAIVRMYVYCV